MNKLLFLLLIALLAGCGMQNFNLQHARDLKTWVHTCTSSRIDLYCKAVSRVLAEQPGPVIVLYPNASTYEITDRIKAVYGPEPTEQQLNALARANMFAGLTFQQGITRSLDGQPHQTSCTGVTCHVDHLVMEPYNLSVSPQEYGGMAYVATPRPVDQPMLFFPK